MTEIDAHIIGESDSRLTLQRVQDAEGPVEIEEIMWGFIQHRLEGLDGGVAGSIGHQLSSSGIEANTLSERLAHKVRGLLMGAAQVLEEEDMQALMLWLVGSPDLGPGYLQQTFQQIQDQTTSEVLLALEELARFLRSRISSVNSRLQAQIKGLSESQQRIIFGTYDEARLATESGDGERARTQLIHARRLSKHLVKVHLRQGRSTSPTPSTRPSLV